MDGRGLADLDCFEKAACRIDAVTTLKSRLKAMIRADGPMPVNAYMNTCLHDPKHGYYATRPGLGADFITAPEISQIFGELLGLWSAHEWQAIGAPDALAMVELGPGHATLMADALRASRSVPGFHNALSLNLVEASPALRALQAKHLAAHAPGFQPDLGPVATGHTIILANEYLDCLPARQFVQDGDNWRERVVGLNANDELIFGLATDRAPQKISRASGTSVELQPSLDIIINQLKQRAGMGDVFRALFIDYGPAGAVPSDTLRAYRAGEQIHPLACPGECDLTVDVDFSRLKRLAETAGLTVHGPVPQGQFLLSLGAETRLNALAKARPEQAEALSNGVRKLISPTEMGTRFKVICISSGDLPTPAGFEV
ncbi:MAG: SAM-dependent methyltransferase [Henriciella sp.]|nr:SAM-dependent methyltransferase [Henriciella sp.]